MSDTQPGSLVGRYLRERYRKSLPSKSGSNLTNKIDLEVRDDKRFLGNLAGFGGRHISILLVIPYMSK